MDSNGYDYFSINRTEIEPLRQVEVRNLTANITSITNLGLLSILFSETVKTDFNDTHVLDLEETREEQLQSVINDSCINITVIPAEIRFEEETYDVSKLGLSWTTQSFDNRTLQLQLEFAEPAEISSELSLDRLLV